MEDFLRGFQKRSAARGMKEGKGAAKLPSLPKPMKPPKPATDVSPPNHGKTKNPIATEQKTQGVNTVNRQSDMGKLGFWKGFDKKAVSKKRLGGYGGVLAGGATLGGIGLRAYRHSQDKSRDPKNKDLWKAIKNKYKEERGELDNVDLAEAHYRYQQAGGKYASPAAHGVNDAHEKEHRETVDYVGPPPKADKEKNKKNVDVLEGDADMDPEQTPRERSEGRPTPREGYRGYPGGI